MNSKSKALATILRAVADFLDNIDDKDIENIAESKKIITIDMKDKTKNTKIRTKIYDKDLKQIKLHLDTTDSREEAESYLQNAASKKSDLIAVAKHLSIPIFNSDTANDVLERIIDATVGYRLRTKAIRGQN